MLLTEPHIKIEELKKIKAKTLVLAGERDIILEKHTRVLPMELLAQNFTP
jgi:hypothetical protein